MFAMEEFRQYLRNEEKSPLTEEKYLRDVRVFRKWLGDRPLSKTETLRFKNWLVDRYAVASVNSMLSSLNCFLSWIGRGECRVKILKTQNQGFRSEERELSREEYCRLLRASQGDRRLNLLLQAICATGIRVSEHRFLTVEALRHGKASVRCKGKVRTVFIPKKLCRVLLSYARELGLRSGPVFVSRKGTPLDRSRIWAMMKSLCAKAGVDEKKVFPHNLRHLFARIYYAMERDIVRLADILGHSSINTTRIYTADTGETFVGDIVSVGGNIAFELKGTGRAAIYNSGAYIGQFGTEGSKITVTSPGLLLHNLYGARIDALGGAGSYVEMIQTTGQNANIRAVYIESGSVGIVGDTNAVVRILQKYEYTGGNNPEIFTNKGTIDAIGGPGATVLMNQTAASGIGFGLRADGGVIKKIGGADVARVEIVSSHIPLYVAAAGTIDEISSNTLFVAKAQFASQAAIWNVGTIKAITGGWFNSANNTVNAIFRTGDNKPGGSKPYAIASIASGYGLVADKTVSIDSIIMGKAYNCYPILPVSEINAEARIGNAYYTGAKAAVSGACSGDTITLLKDLSYNGQGLYFTTASQNVTLNLNNHSVTAADYALLNRGKISIYGGDMKDAQGNPLQPGKLITTGTSVYLSVCIYNQRWETVNGVLQEYDAHIYSIGGNLELIDTNGAATGAIYNYGGHIGQIGTEGGKIVVKGPGELLYMSSEATLDVLGGAGSTVELIQEGTKSITTVYMTDASITTVGAENATVKIVQNGALTGHGKQIFLNGKATITNFGVADGSKVLVDQIITSGKTGWAVYLTTYSEITNIGGPKSKVEIIGRGYPLYCTGNSNYGNITGDTLLVTKVRDGNYNDILWVLSPLNSITGGYYCCVNSNNVPDRIFNEMALEVIEESGYQVSEVTVARTSEITGETYDCCYLLKQHEHTYSAEPTVEWTTKDGQVVLTAVVGCDEAGCVEMLTAESAATVSYETVGNIYRATYSATVTLNGHEYTKTKTEDMEIAGTKTMQYDDCLTSEDIRILDAGTPTSKKVGSGELDDAVLTAYDNMLVATGIGNAKVIIDGKLYDVTVEKAVIDLFMITGHSLGMGSKGTTSESVVINDGSAYSFTVTNTDNGPTSYRYIDLIPETEGVGLGYAAENRPPEVDNFTVAGGGVIGEDSGLAWKWNQLTGHKVYVVNSAVGSTSIYHWSLNKSNSESPVPILDNAIQNFTYARQIIQNEVDAGHFVMGNMALINHNGANFTTADWSSIKMLWNDADGKTWYAKVLGDICTAMNIDWDGDGTVEAGETMSIGFIPNWSETNGPSWWADRPASQFMGVTDDSEYAHMFTASLLGREWSSDEKVVAYFNDYVTPFSIHNGKAPVYPTDLHTVYADGVHYVQTVYNVIGMDLAENLYTFFLDPAADEDVSLKLFKTDGVTEIAADGEDALTLKAGEKLVLVPVADPISANKFTFETTGAITLDYPLTLSGNAGAEGTLTVSYKGRVLKTVAISIEQGVAQIGDKQYATLPEAINAAQEGDTVKLLRDINLGSAAIVVPADKSIHLDLNNHSITGTNHVLINRGTLLSLNGGALQDAEGNDLPAGKLITTGATKVASALYNQHTSDGEIYVGKINLICGNLELRSSGAVSQGALVNDSGAYIGQIGGAGSNIHVISGTYVLDARATSEIGTIGNGGKVTFTQANIAGSKGNLVQYPFHVAGKIGTIGGTNGDVTIQQTNILDAFSSTVFLAGGRIDTIGGENAVVNIIQNDQCTTAGTYRNAIWVSSNASIGTLGAGGTVNIISNGMGVYMGGSSNVVRIENIATAGTVNITGPTVDGEETPCKAGIGIGSASGVGDIGVLGAGGTVNINASDKGIFLWAGTADIGSIATAGTVNIYGGNRGISVETAGAKIVTLGAGGTVNVTSPNYALYTIANTEITTIGNGGTVSFVQDNTNGTATYAFRHGGKIGTLGGPNSVVTVQQINKLNKNTATMFIESSGRIDTVGSENATVNIIENDQCKTFGEFRIAIWINTGSIGILGNGGTVNIISNHNGIYFGGSDACDAYIEKIATAGTVNIVGPTVNGSATSCRIGIRVNATKHTNDIGILGGGGTVNINAREFGVHVEKANSDIGIIGNAGTVNITSDGNAIKLSVAGGKIGTIGAGGTVNLLSKLETIRSTGGRIDRIGGENANVNIDNTIGTNNNAVYIDGDSSIGTIGSTGTGLVKINAYYRGILLMNAGGNTVEKELEAISGNVEINSGGAAMFVALDNTVDVIGGAGSRIKMNQKGPSDPAIYLQGKINTLGYGEDCLVEITSIDRTIYMSTTASVIDTLGGENSTVILTQNATGAVEPKVISTYGTINTIGAKNATVKMFMTSDATGDNGNGKLINVFSGAKINNIGTAAGSKVLIDQTMLSNKCGWGLYVSGTIGTIGSDASLVEVIADHSPVYLAGKIGLITGNTLMVGKRDYSSSTNAFWMSSGKTVDSITGGYYAQGGVTITDTYVNYIFDAANQAKITGTAAAPTGYEISKQLVDRYSETTQKTYKCIQVGEVHEHAFTEMNTAEEFLNNAGNCTTAPSYFYSCACGEKGTETFTHGEPLGHSYTQQRQGSQKSAATCTDPAVHYVKCDNCDYEDTTQTMNVGQELGHSFTVLQSETLATCVAEGERIMKCANCAETQKTVLKINPDNHVQIEQVDAKAPTCVAIGWNAYEHCTSCDYTTYEELPIDEDAHKWGEPAYGWNGEEGTYSFTATRSCAWDIGHEEYLVSKNVERKVVLEPTCKAVGAVQYTAAFEADWAEEQVYTFELPVNPSNHSFTEYVYNNDATIYADGTETATCDHGCGAEDNRTAAGTQLTAVAQIGDTVYATLAEALAAAKEQTDATVILLANITDAVVVNQAVTINKNGFTATITAGEGYALKSEGDTVIITKKVSVDYKFQQSTQLGLIEPWFLKSNLYVNANGAYLTEDELSGLKDFGVYFVRASKLGNPEQLPSVEDIINDADTIQYSKNGTDRVAKIEKGSGGYMITASYVEGIYTYELNDPVYVLYYIEDASGIHYDVVKTRNLLDIATKAQHNTSFDVTERTVYTRMVELHKAITEHRATFDSIPEMAEIAAPKVTAGMFGSYQTGYTVNHSTNIILIEPWGIRLNGYVDKNVVLEDSGVVVFYDKDGKYEEAPSVDELVNNTEAYVLSTSNGNATASASGSYTKIIADFNKVVRGLKVNAAKGKWNGGTLPIGYVVDEEQHLQINEMTAPHVVEAFKQYDEGKTIAEIQSYFKEKGITNTKGRAVSWAAVQHMLSNRRYIGEYSFRDIVIPDGIPAIVPLDLFERVQEKLEKNKKAPARAKAVENYLLSTKIFCGHCGATMNGESGTGRNGTTHRYYKCHAVKTKKNDCKGVLLNGGCIGSAG